MLPPVLEVYVVWHPQDTAGEGIANEVLQHFHGTAFTGLMGGAVEVFMRSAPWLPAGGAPRPIFTPQPSELEPAMFTAIVPILGLNMAKAAQDDGPWSDYLRDIVAAQKARPDRIGVFPYRQSAAATDGTQLSAILGVYQTFAAGRPDSPDDLPADLRCRDLSQALAQFVGGKTGQQLIVFISHTKHSSTAELAEVSDLIALVKSLIATTHVGEFFDARSLQPGTDWSSTLKTFAGTSALLVLRTDLYPSREWCQREILVAKQNGMPVVIMDGLGYGEERGSFLMDHVPRTPARTVNRVWSRHDVYRALNLLIDECLKRALWRRQQELSRDRTDLAVSWWAPHAPEPLTLIQWLQETNGKTGFKERDAQLRILHPDPPLGPDELAVLKQMVSFSGLTGEFDVMTPRQLASRGG